MDPVSKAQAAETSHSRRKLRGGHDPSIGKQWPKGVSGNPGGRSKKARITKIYEEIFESSKNRDEIKDSVFLTLKSGRMAGVLLLREAAERLEGKVAQELEVSGSLTTMSDEDLEKKLAKLLGK